MASRFLCAVRGYPWRKLVAWGSMTGMVEIVGPEEQQLGRLEPVDPRSIWSHEALNFTPWLAQNADRLAEALGIELEFEATEYGVGGYSLDILGKDGTNGVVLIVENQLGDSDHGHLGQLLTYAAGTAASTIVWITTRFRDEHRQALTWLNEHTDQETHFFGVELEVVRIGNSVPAPLFKVVALPNDWQKSVRAATVSPAGSRNELYRQFWSKLLDRIKSQYPSWTRAVGGPQSGSGSHPRSAGVALILSSGSRARSARSCISTGPRQSNAAESSMPSMRDVTNSRPPTAGGWSGTRSRDAKPAGSPSRQKVTCSTRRSTRSTSSSSLMRVSGSERLSLL